MKRNWIFPVLCLLSLNANALIVSVDKYGEIDLNEGLEITVSEAEMDLLSGAPVMKLNGSLLANGTVTVTIERSESGVTDEFCCGICKAGDGALTQEMNFSVNGTTAWYIHYTPQAGSLVTIRYTISDGTESCVLTVHYDYSTQDVDNIEAQPKARKIIRDGLLLIQQGDKTYNL